MLARPESTRPCGLGKDFVGWTSDDPQPTSLCLGSTEHVADKGENKGGEGLGIWVQGEADPGGRSPIFLKLKGSGGIGEHLSPIAREREAAEGGPWQACRII